MSHEGARHLDDLLTRRTRISIETFDRGVAAAPLVARLMADELGWDEERVDEEVDHYLRRVEAERQSQRRSPTRRPTRPGSRSRTSSEASPTGAPLGSSLQPSSGEVAQSGEPIGFGRGQPRDVGQQLVGEREGGPSLLGAVECEQALPSFFVDEAVVGADG